MTKLKQFIFCVLFLSGFVLFGFLSCYYLNHSSWHRKTEQKADCKNGHRWREVMESAGEDNWSRVRYLAGRECVHCHVYEKAEPDYNTNPIRWVRQ